MNGFFFLTTKPPERPCISCLDAASHNSYIENASTSTRNRTTIKSSQLSLRDTSIHQMISILPVSLAMSSYPRLPRPTKPAGAPSLQARHQSTCPQFVVTLRCRQSAYNPTISMQRGPLWASGPRPFGPLRVDTAPDHLCGFGEKPGQPFGPLQLESSDLAPHQPPLRLEPRLIRLLQRVQAVRAVHIAAGLGVPAVHRAPDAAVGLGYALVAAVLVEARALFWA